MNDSVTISSVNNSTKLTFSDARNAEFAVTLEGRGFSCCLNNISSYHSGFPDPLFEEMAAEWKGWKDEKRWASLEGELKLSARTDKWGHVFLNVLLGVENGRENWKLEAELSIEPGQLEMLATSLNKLFSTAKIKFDR